MFVHKEVDFCSFAGEFPDKSISGETDYTFTAKNCTTVNNIQYTVILNGNRVLKSN